MFQATKKLSKEYILENVLQEDIFEKYLGLTPNFTDRFCNPLRDDDTPDCRFYLDKRGMIKFHDIAMRWNWDCFNVVQHIFSCNFYTALTYIAEDFRLVDNQNLSEPSKKKKLSKLIEEHKSKTKLQYKVTRGVWDKTSLEFWKQFDLDEEILVQYGVYPIKTLWVDRGFGDEITYQWSKSDIGYVYHFGGYNYKFYFPLRDKKGAKPRFIEESQIKGILQGEKLLPPTGEILVITKSYKDVIVLASFEIPAVAPQGESVIISEKKIMTLKKRFTNVVSLMDFDLAGVRAANRLRKYDIPCFFLTNGRFSTEDYGAKDVAEFINKYGPQELLDLINYVYTQIKTQ